MCENFPQIFEKNSQKPIDKNYIYIYIIAVENFKENGDTKI